MKSLFYLFGLLLVLLPFQNCSQFVPLLHQQSSTVSSKDSGNGGGYEGKLEAVYYRYIPNYMCENTPVAQQYTEIRDGVAILYENKKNQCADQSEGTLVADINYSPFQKEFVSIQDSLFKKYDTKPEGIPNNLAEILCRDDFTNPTFEIVSHYDREKNLALARIYFDQKSVPDFSISRVVSPAEVRYVSQSLSFKVDISKPAFTERKFSGVIEKSSIPGVSAGKVTCVVGGSLDTTKWSVKTLGPVNAGGFNVMKNGDLLMFGEYSRTHAGAGIYLYVNHLYRIDYNTGQTSDFSEALLGINMDVEHYISTNSDDLLVFAVKKTSEMWPSTYVYDQRSGKVKKLSNLGTNTQSEAWTMMAPVLTKDDFLFYDSRKISFTGADSAIVRVYDMKADTIHDVGIIDRGDCNSYQVLPEKNQAVIFCKNNLSGENFLRLYDGKTKTLREIRLDMSPDCSVAGYSAYSSAGDHSIVTQQACVGAGGAVTRATVQIIIDEGRVKVLIPGANEVTWFSSDQKWALLTTPTNQSTLYDFSLGRAIPVPINTELQGEETEASRIASYTNFIRSNNRIKIAYTNGAQVYGFGGTKEAPKMYQVDLTTGKSSLVCEEAVGKKLFIGSLADKKAFLFTYDVNLKVFHFYQAKSSKECVRINEFPSLYEYVPELMPTEIGFGLILGKPLTRYEDATAREAVFVPVDGRPPIKFNTATQHNWNMEVTPDKNRIYLRGPGSDGLLKLFAFDL